MVSPPPRQDPFVFGRFTLAADASLLTDAGVPVPLAPKVLQTLRALVARAGQVVGKDDLMREVWGDTFVEEIGLARNVSLLRRALGPDGDRLIVTVPRIGYRFAGPVERDRPAPPVAPATTFVGRSAELAALQSALSEAHAGRGGLVGLTGEPGIGKTMLAEQFLAAARVTCHGGVGRSSDLFGTTEPHLPVLEALEELTRSTPTLAEALRAVAPTWAGHVLHAPGMPESAASTPERLLRELTNFLDVAAADRPIVLVLDDVQWADAATVDVIAHLARRLTRMRVLIVATYRDRTMAARGGPFTQVRTELLARRALHEIALPLLGLEEVTTYVARAAAPLQGDGLVAQVYASSEGNPLFMSALVTYLVASGLPDGGSRTTATPMPASLRALIQASLAALTPAQRDVLDAAAIYGPEFEATTIAWATATSPLEVEDVLTAITDDHGLIVRQTPLVAGDRDTGDTYRFRHALYQTALLDALPPSRRAHLAARLADGQRARHGDDPTMAGSIAKLFETARAHAEAAHWFARASAHASARLGFRDAHDLALRGVRCLASADALDPDRRTRLELDLTFAQLVPLSSWRGHGHPTTVALVERASVLAARLQDPASMARALGLTCFVHLIRAECTAARAAALRLIALAEDTGNPVLQMNGHLQAQIACHHLGDFASADVHAAEVERFGPQLPPRDRFINVFDPLVGSLAESSRNAWITGRLARAAGLAEEAVAVGAEIGNLESLSFAWLFHAWLHGYKGDWRTCLQSADQGIAVARHGGTVQTLAWNRCVHGWARALNGDPAGGRDELREGLELSRAIMGHVALPQFRVMMAQAHLANDSVADARACIEDALHAAREHDDGYVAAEVHRFAALCGAVGPAGLTPLEHVHEALAMARAQGATFFELRAALTLADLTGELEPVADALTRLPEPEPWPDVVAARQRLAGPGAVTAAS